MFLISPSKYFSYLYTFSNLTATVWINSDPYNFLYSLITSEMIFASIFVRLNKFCTLLSMATVSVFGIWKAGFKSEVCIDYLFDYTQETLYLRTLIFPICKRENNPCFSVLLYKFSNKMYLMLLTQFLVQSMYSINNITICIFLRIWFDSFL